MFVLDSDHMSLLDWGGRESAALRERLADISENEIATTIICYEEQIRGWMAYIARSKTISQELKAYQKLRSHLDNYRIIQVLDFDKKAADEFQQLKNSKIRIGTMDLKIASIVLSRGDTLLSRNRVDFSKVPGLKMEDWSA
jgi:tRNA(fMet)-specific endonuclease VapC